MTTRSPETKSSRPAAEPDGRSRTRTYVGVLVVEVAVLIALWLLGNAFV